ncbi:MAG: PAS domain S-box protein [Candidatus Thorarchaeota archaeon]
MEQTSESVPDWLTKQILSLTDDAIYIIDKNLNIVAANDVIEKWSKKNGFTASITGKHINDALPFIREKEIADVTQVLETAKPLSSEYVWPIEQDVIIMANIMPVFTNEETVQAITIARNLGEQRKIIDGIIKRELSTKLLLEQVNDGIFIYTLEGTVLYANAAISSQLGYTHDEFMKLQPVEIDISANEELFPIIREELLRKGRLLYETVFVSKNYKKISTEVNCSIIDYFGEKAILSISRDVSERRMVIDGLTRGLAHLVEAQSIACVGSWDWRIKDNTYEWSAGIFDILEIDNQPVNHNTFYKFIHKDDIIRIRKAVQKCFDERSEFNAVYRLELNDGKVKVVRGIGRVIVNEEGEVTRFFGTMTDITEMHAIRLELERSNLDLDLYSSFLHHDLRNDLHIIQMQAEASNMQHLVSNEESDTLDLILSAAKRMSKLLETFTLSSAISKKNLLNMLYTAIHDAKSLHPNLQIELINNSTIESNQISTGRLLPLVWTNLLRNVVTFAGEEARVQITISNTRKSIIVDVADNGPGISKSVQRNLFEKGVSTTGSGYGLYLCRKIIEAYGGTIELFKTNRKGATFRITLV